MCVAEQLFDPDVQQKCDLRKGLYRIDLGDVLFECTGETEKNLATATKAARQRAFPVVRRLVRRLMEA